MQIEQKQNCFLMLYAQLIVYNKYSWLFSENPTHFRRGSRLKGFAFNDLVYPPSLFQGFHYRIDA